MLHLFGLLFKNSVAEQQRFLCWPELVREAFWEINLKSSFADRSRCQQADLFPIICSWQVHLPALTLFWCSDGSFRSWPSILTTHYSPSVYSAVIILVSTEPGACLGVRKCSREQKQEQEGRRRSSRRQSSPQRRVRPPPWGAGELWTWTEQLIGRMKKQLRRLRSQAEDGESPGGALLQLVSASQRERPSGAEAGFGVCAGILETGGLSFLLLCWDSFETGSNNREHGHTELLLFIQVMLPSRPEHQLGRPSSRCHFDAVVCLLMLLNELTNSS